MNGRKNNPVLTVVGIFLGLVMAFPFLWGVMLSFKDNYGIFNEPLKFPAKLDFGLYVHTFNDAHILVLFKNSISLSVVETFIGLVMLFFSSFAIARLNHKHRRMGDIAYYMFLSSNGVPVMVLLMTYYFTTMTLGNITGGLLGLDSIWGLVLPYIAGGIPFTTLMLVGSMKSVPIEMEEAGIIDGCSLLRMMFTVELPLLKPIMVTLVIFSFLGVWNEFPIASILLSSWDHYTLPLAMAFFKDQFSADYGSMLRGVTIILVPQLVFFIIFQKQVMEGMVTVGLKG